MNDPQFKALLAIHLYVTELSVKVQTGDTAAALEALAELRLATSALKSALTKAKRDV